jgi:hypothetical protein
MSERTSNKQLMDAINALPAAIAAAIAAVPATAAPVVATVPEAPKQAPTVEVDESYKNHVLVEKVQPFANKHGETAVLYARRNGRGETKLAYCLASKWTGLKDRGLLGAIATVEPS